VERPTITSIAIVPHRDLAYQLLHWITRITTASTSFSPPPVSSVCQVLVREGTTLLSSRISKLREDPPHILIGTPQALLEVWKSDPDALRLESLSTIVVDEVDYLIESVPRKPSQKMMEKARKKIDRHPSATRQLLDAIYASRVKASKDYSGDDSRPHRNVTMSHLPQLIMSSATLRNHLKTYLFNESGWLRRDKLKKVVGSRNDQPDGTFTAIRLRGDRKTEDDTESEEVQNVNQSGAEISHYVLVLSGSGDIVNIEGTTPAEAHENSEEIVSTEDGQAITPVTLFYSPEPPDAPVIAKKLTESV